MKTLRMIAICGILLPGFLSCSKEKEARFDPIDSMYETFTGKQGAGTEDPADFLQLKLEEHGSLLSFSTGKALPGKGMWMLSGHRFRGTFRQSIDNMQITLEGVYDPVENKISGSWGYGEFAIGGGSFYVENKKHSPLLASKQTGFSTPPPFLTTGRATRGGF